MRTRAACRCCCRSAVEASEIFDVDVRTPGIVVKTRKGLTTFGEGLADDENRYLHAIILRALR